jgi:hypothetical protein
MDGGMFPLPAQSSTAVGAESPYLSLRREPHEIVRQTESVQSLNWRKISISLKTRVQAKEKRTSIVSAQMTN